MSKSPEFGSSEDRSKQDGPFELHLPIFKKSAEKPTEQPKEREFSIEERDLIINLEQWLEETNKQIEGLQETKKRLEFKLRGLKGDVPNE